MIRDAAGTLGPTKISASALNVVVGEAQPPPGCTSVVFWARSTQDGTFYVYRVSTLLGEQLIFSNGVVGGDLNLLSGWTPAMPGNAFLRVKFDNGTAVVAFVTVDYARSGDGKS